MRLFIGFAAEMSIFGIKKKVPPETTAHDTILAPKWRRGSSIAKTQPLVNYSLPLPDAPETPKMMAVRSIENAISRIENIANEISKLYGMSASDEATIREELEELRITCDNIANPKWHYTRKMCDNTQLEMSERVDRYERALEERRSRRA